MNEDIFERLHYHSGLVAQGCWNELDEYDRAAIKRFGDLIVKECADYANWYQANSRYTDIAKAIKEHFGVDE